MIDSHMQHGPNDALKTFGDVDKGKIKGKVLLKLLVFAKPYYKKLIIAFFLMLISTLTLLIIPYWTKIIIDDNIIKKDLAGLITNSVLLIAVMTVCYVSTSFQYYILSWISQKILNDLRVKLFTHIQDLSVSYHNNNIIGVTISRIISDVAVINNLITEGIISILSDVLLITGIIGIMISLNPILALLSFAVIPFMILVSFIFSHHAKKAFRQTRESIGAVIGDLSENLSGIRVTKAFNQEHKVQKRFSKKNVINRDANIKAVSLSFIFIPAIDFLSMLAVCIVIGAGIFMLSTPATTLTIGIIVAFISYVNRFFMPIRDMTQIYTTLQSASAGGEKILELLETKPLVTDRDNTIELDKIKGDILIKNLSFEYISGQKVLTDINLSVKSGDIIAIVGPTGSGKSTIANLICRFYPCPDNTIFIDGHDINSLKMELVHKNMGYVPQDPILFNTTIFDNIKFSKPEASMDEVIQSCKKLNIHNYIEKLPHGYNTNVLESGVNLSQGQKQLICIARAMLSDPKILIMDEATSNIDALTENIIQKAIQKLYKGRTSIVIAHRLTTVKNAANIFVLNQGRIIEKGNHEYLINLKGMYKELYDKQFIE